MICCSSGSDFGKVLDPVRASVSVLVPALVLDPDNI
jgi:hypothetical protein